MSDRNDTHPDPDGLVAPEVQGSLITALERGAGAPTDARPTRRRRALVALGTAVVVAGVVVGISAAGPSDGPADIVGEARAALSPQREIVHYVVKATLVEPSDGLDPKPLDGPCVQTGSTEIWQATAPDRWRAVLPANRRGQRCGRTFDRRGREVIGRTEVSWDRGTTGLYRPGLRELDIVRGYPANSSARNVPVGDERLGTGDPVAVLRRLLASGTVRDTGGRTLDGRDVRVLQGTIREGHGPKLTRTTEVLYAVDAESFAPVRAVTTLHYRPRPGQRLDRDMPILPTYSFGQQLDFTVYERLPLTPRTERLLQIRPADGTNTTDQTLAEFKREIRRDLRRERARAKPPK